MTDHIHTLLRLIYKSILWLYRHGVSYQILGRKRQRNFPKLERDLMSYIKILLSHGQFFQSVKTLWKKKTTSFGAPLLIILFFKQRWLHNTLGMYVQVSYDKISTIQHSKLDKLPSSIAVQILAKIFGLYFSVSNWTSKLWFIRMLLGIFLSVILENMSSCNKTKPEFLN